MEKDVTSVDGQTDTHSEYSVNPRLVDSDSQKNNWHGVVSAFDEGN